MLLKKSLRQISSGNRASAKVKGDIFFKNSGAIKFRYLFSTNVKKNFVSITSFKVTYANLQCVREDSTVAS